MKTLLVCVMCLFTVSAFSQGKSDPKTLIIELSQKKKAAAVAVDTTRNFYVSNTGNDALSGRTQDSAWQTLSKVSGSTFQGTDSIFLKKGGTWREELTEPSSGSLGKSIVFAAYSTGANPVINGADIASSAWTQIAASQSLHDSLKGYWNMNEQSGTRYDSSGLHDNILEDNNPGYAAGKVGNAAAYAGSGDLYIADNGYLSMGNIDFTVSGWVYFYASTGTQYVCSKAASNDAAGIEFRIYRPASPHKLYFGISNGTALEELASTETINDSTWYHFVVWYDAANDRLDVQINNGTAADTGPITTGSQNTAGKFGVGTYPGSFSNSFSGRVDELGIWKRTLTASEKTYLYNTGSGTTWPLVAANSNIWRHINVVDTCNQVFFNGTKGTFVSGKYSCISPYQWSFANDSVWVYSTSDPATAWTNPGVEVSMRDYPVRIRGKSYITVDGIDVRYANTSAIMIYDDGKTGASNCIVKNLRTSYNGWTGVEANYPNITVQNVRADHNGTSPLEHHGFYMGWSASDKSVHADNFLVENCTADSNSGSGIQCYLSGSGTIRYNRIFNNGSSAGGWGLIIDTTKTACTINVYYNLIYGNKYRGVQISNLAVDTVNLDNNTIYGNADTEWYSGLDLESIEAANARVRVRNNIIAFNNWHDVWQTEATTPYSFSNNLYYRASGNMITWNGTTYTQAQFATYQAASGDATSLSADPLVTNGATFDFSLQAGSPCLGAGANLGYTRDYAGTAVGATPDIGAYERP